MKSETLIVVVALLIVGIIILKNFTSKKLEVVNNTAEENKVAYRYDIEDQNFTDFNQNVIETVTSNDNMQNVIDVSAIEQLRNASNN